MSVNYSNSSRDQNVTGFGDEEAEGSTLTVNVFDFVKIILLCLLVVISLMGNTLVVTAVVKEQRLRTYTNYFIVSLACADLLVSVVVVPVSITYQIMHRWMFGQIMCTLYTSLDIMCCTASIINLCAISLDRYWAIVTPFKYQQKMTRKTCPIIIACVWISSAMIALAQIAWRYVMGEMPGEDSEDDPQCQISLDLSFRIFSSMSSFYVPLVVMLFTYSRIFAVARRQSKAMAEQMRQCTPIGQQNGVSLANEQRRLTEESTCNEKKTSRPSFLGSLTHLNRLVRRATKLVSSPLGQATELKAFKTLSIVMGVFTINWLPFFVLYLVEGVRHKQDEGYWSVIVVWLGYFNSVLNPFIYFFFNKQYKEAFIKLLCPGRFRQRMANETKLMTV